jgi:hypothetical protein
MRRAGTRGIVVLTVAAGTGHAAGCGGVVSGGAAPGVQELGAQELGVQGAKPTAAGGMGVQGAKPPAAGGPATKAYSAAPFLRGRSS